MAKKKSSYICSACGADFPKWLGKCTNCNEWNTLEEVITAKSISKGKKTELIQLSSISSEEIKRITTGINEFNLVCGGGIVPGSVILIGGEPGIGKSTLAMQIAHFFKTLYISGEESPNQLRQRSGRLNINHNSVTIATTTIVEEIIHVIEKEKPECVIIDSIQTIRCEEVPGISGSVSQIRESTARLVEIAKRTDIPILLIGHITKDGAIAGPKLLEHLVDTVLYFEGNFTGEYRLLRAIKNRFGSINEIGIFTMTEKGLQEVTDKNRIFLSPSLSQAPGNAISAALEGSRTILFEVQSLVSFTGAPNPRRMADGFDVNRLILMTAVLEKHGGLKLNSFDVFINVSGGFQINETASDLAVALSITSSLKNIPIPESTGFLGEISLSGELRPVSQCNRRIKEFMVSGFKNLVVSKSDLKEAADAGFEGSIVGINHINEAIERLF